MSSRRDFLFGRGKVVIRLPWSCDQSFFVNNCTRCYDCINVCESKIIIIGRGGFPEIDFDYGECTFCGQCAAVCQLPLFSSTQSIAFHHQVMIADHCLTNQMVACRSCGESCDVSAIVFRPQLGKVSQPVLLNEQCTGCGGCIGTCPVNAIKVVNHAVACV